MPELPEVETVLQTLKYQLQYPTIESVNVRYEPIIQTPKVNEFQQLLQQKTIQDYRRIGKYMIFDFGSHVLVAHMRMEGKFYVQRKEDPYDQKHVHVIFRFTDGRELRYHDTRKFGRMALYEKQAEDHLYPCFKNVGYDALDETFTSQMLYQAYHQRKITLKQALLDQSIMAGVGNIYADEICFSSHLHPATRCYKLSKKDCENILFHTRRILKGAIRFGGTTIRSYTSQLGVDGRFQLQLKVHQREQEPCLVCGTTIKKVKLAGRGTYICTKCQKRK